MDLDGNFTVSVPRGLIDGILHARTIKASTKTIPRAGGGFGGEVVPLPPIQPKWRTDKDKPLVAGEETPIGRVDADVGGIEIVYPDPPQPTAPAQPARPARGAAAGG
jgi:hypothetical protein